MPPGGDVTDLLIAFREGEKDAFERLMPLLYDELRRVARRQLGRHQQGITLGATALVHEVYLKMADQTRLDARDRGHFLAIAARAMRQVVVDHSRRRAAVKRGSDVEVVPLDEAPQIAATEAQRLLAVDEALERLGQRSERLARVVECRFFAGYSEQETAEALGASLRTVQREWMRARAWLREELGS